MYRGRFLYLYGLLLAVGAAAVIAFLGWTAFGQQVRVETRTRPAPPLTEKSTMVDVRARLDGPPAQSIPGSDLGLEGGTCDVWFLADAAVLVCHV